MKEKIFAIANDNLTSILEGLNLLDSLESNSLKCNICGETLTLENIGCLYPLNKKIFLCCDKISCIQKVVDLLKPTRRILSEGASNEI